MKSTSLLVSVAFGLLCGVSSLDGETKAQSGPAKTPELKVLDRLVGQWKDEMIFLVPKEEPLTATYTNRWVLDGRFLWSEGMSDGKILDIQIMTYEPGKKEYHKWFFGSGGVSNE